MTSICCPFSVADSSPAEEAPESQVAHRPAGSINIEFPGRVLISIEGQVDAEVVRAVLEIDWRRPARSFSLPMAV